MKDKPRKSKRKDVLLCLLFLSVGSLIVAYAYLAMRNDVPRPLWAIGWVVGPLLLFIGGGGLLRILRGRDE